MIEFGEKFQFRCYLVSLTHGANDSTTTAFVLTVHNAWVCIIYPIIVSGFNHSGTILWEQRVWAQKDGKKWQGIDVIVQERQGVICESSTKLKTFVLTLNKNVCHFETHSREIPENVFNCTNW